MCFNAGSLFYKKFFYFTRAVFLASMMITAAWADDNLKIASKAYVDSIVAHITLAHQSNWGQTDVNSADYVKNKPDLGTAAAADITDFATAAQGAKADTAAQLSQLSQVATSGSYKDLIDKPHVNIVSNSIENAVTNSEFYVEMGGFRFRAFKASSTDYWGARIMNNTGSSIVYGSIGLHYYTSTQVTDKRGTLENGAEYNPDSESNDIGYSREDVFVTHFFDTTNMHLYRWTISVYVNKAIMAVERLH